jgi:hypothetical protein
VQPELCLYDCGCLTAAPTCGLHPGRTRDIDTVAAETHTAMAAARCTSLVCKLLQKLLLPVLLAVFNFRSCVAL